MASPTAPFCIVEQTDFVLRVARCTGRNRPLQIDSLQEIVVTEISQAAQAAAAAVANGGDVICAIRPATRRLRLSSIDEAKKYRGAAGARQLASGPEFASFPPEWLALAPASIDAGDPRWLLELTSAESRREITAALETAGVKPTLWTSTTLAGVGAVCGLASGPTWLLDIGKSESHALLVSRGAVQMVGNVSVSLDKIAEAVQTELGLKFRGSAAKLFFNDQYDFSEVGAKIAERLAPTLQTELAAIRGKRDEPTLLTVLGLPSKQHWLSFQLAAALKLEALKPDLAAWGNTAGLVLSKPDLQPFVSPAGVSLFQTLSAQAGTPAATRWQIEWLKADAIAATPAAAPQPAAAPRPVPAPAIQPAKVLAPEPAVVVASGGAARAVAELPKSPASPASGRAPLPPMPVIIDTPAPSTNARKQPASKPVESSVRYSGGGGGKSSESSASYPPKPAGKGSATPAATLPPPPPSRTPSLPDESPAAIARPAKKGSSKGLLIGLVAAILAIGAGSYVYIQNQNAEKAKLAAERVKLEQQMKAEAEKARLAAAQAQSEAENRKKFEAEALKKLADAEAGRKQAEAEARAQAAARLAAARGALTLNTDPTGATVTISGSGADTTPATITDLKLGHYTAVIAHPLCESTTVEFDIKENVTTNLGTIKLTKVVGSLAVTSDPVGINYEVMPAGVILVTADARRSGQTPANLADLKPGEYNVTFTRDGWSPHTEKVTVTRGETVTATWALSGGAVRFVTVPAGAAVMQNGTKIGVTPLTLADQPVGDAVYELVLNGYSPTRVSGHVERGQVLVINRRLNTLEHIATLAELEQLPVPITQPQPVIARGQEHDSGSVVVQLVVDRDGLPKNIEVTKSTDPILARACVEAVAKWKFKPGTIGGKPVNSRVLLPFNFDSQ